MKTIALLIILGIVFAVINDETEGTWQDERRKGFRSLVKRADTMQKALKRIHTLEKRGETCVSEGDACEIYVNDDDDCCPGLECECIEDDPSSCVCAMDVE